MDSSPQSDPLISPTGITIRVVIGDLQEALNKPAGHYRWARACKRQFVTFRHITIIGILASIRARIPDARYVCTMYARITKRPTDGRVLGDTECLVTIGDLQDFIYIVKGIYIPITIQVQPKVLCIHPKNPTPSNERLYFARNEFNTYNPLLSHPEHDLCPIQFGKSKPRVWPRSDHGFDHKKAEVRKRTNRIKKLLQKLKS